MGLGKRNKQIRVVETEEIGQGKPKREERGTRLQTQPGWTYRKEINQEENEFNLTIDVENVYVTLVNKLFIRNSVFLLIIY